MVSDFNILNLPDGVTVELIDRMELRKVMNMLWHDVFPDSAQLPSEAPSLERENARKEVAQQFRANIFCLDMVFKEKLNGSPIGWIMGEQHDSETFYLRNSGFIPKFRRKGIYSVAHAAIAEYLKKRGFERMVSDHDPNNKPVLILKIKGGYVINNITLDDRFGPMVRLVKFLYEDRQKIFESRFRLPDYGLD